VSYIELFEKMQQGNMVSYDWRNILKLLDSTIGADADKDQYLKIFILYFSLIDDGNVYMPLNAAILLPKFEKKIDGLKVQSAEEDSRKDAFYDDILSEVKDLVSKASSIASCSLIGDDILFYAEDNCLYTRKYFNALLSINKSVARLFRSNTPLANPFDYKTIVAPGFRLSTGQEEVLTKSFYNNTWISGGPGTGKTTSVFFLLLSLLICNSEYTIYLAAPAGKAASRMKDSILSSKAQIISPGVYQPLIDKICALEEYTIHRLLTYDPNGNVFKFTKDKQFPENTIFVIDESSMIDVNIFASLLEAIPDGARVFFMGDKNQLPSVECGAVFGALLSRTTLVDNTVEIKESKRFSASSEIYELSEKINAGEDLSYISDKWQPWEKFNIDVKIKTNEEKTKEEKEAEQAEKKAGSFKTPICYYLDKSDNDTKMIDTIVCKWYEEFYQSRNLYDKCSSVEYYDGLVDTGKLDEFDAIWNIAENSRILSASNNGSRGVNRINSVLLKKYFKDKQKISGYYPGELLMITKNDNALNLYNGDCGVSVKFTGDDTLYLMLKKGTKLKLDERKVENKIFKLGDYLFYPIRLISSEDISPAFAITVHKSQGSDYDNILVILPKLKGHPLLNRQIVYTAITRTKGCTYILSNQENLECARDNVLIRDTFNK